jgi:multidrug resistance protein
MSLRNSRATAVAFVTFATFTDIVAYSIAVPVLPDLSRRLGASATTIGLLFSSFGITLLTVSIPSGALSDRVGRRTPLVVGLLALAAATLLFAFSNSLPLLFSARLVQGAADAVTWVVGFALIADLYGAHERGRVTGIVMSGTSFAFMIGPSLGGWLYEIGGIGLPFIAVCAMALVSAGTFAWFQIPPVQAPREPVPILAVVREPAIASCTAAVVAASATISMLEPILALHLATLGIGPARTGVLFGIAAVATMTVNPVYGRLADRYGARRMTIVGLVVSACLLPLTARAWSFESALWLYLVQATGVALVITPSLAYMGEATSEAGLGSFGVAYGLYNMAWGVGLLGGPALGGFLYERIGFARLGLVWAPVVILVTMALVRVRSRPVEARDYLGR